MRRALPLVLMLAAALSGAVRQPSIDRSKLDRVRRLAPAERARLRDRLAQLKQLPRAERQRLQDNLKQLNALPPEQVRNLREKIRHLTPEERKEYSELAAGFFHWGQRRALHERFPRWIFFAWLKLERPEEVARIRALEPGVGGGRIDAFAKLTVEFRGYALRKLEEHVRAHGCARAEEVQALRDAPPEELWPRFQEILDACSRRAAAPTRPPDVRRK